MVKKNKAAKVWMTGVVACLAVAALIAFSGIAQTMFFSDIINTNMEDGIVAEYNSLSSQAAHQLFKIRIGSSEDFALSQIEGLEVRWVGYGYEAVSRSIIQNFGLDIYRGGELMWEKIESSQSHCSNDGYGENVIWTKYFGETPSEYITVDDGVYYVELDAYAGTCYYVGEERLCGAVCSNVVNHHIQTDYASVDVILKNASIDAPEDEVVIVEEEDGLPSEEVIDSAPAPMIRNSMGIFAISFAALFAIFSIFVYINRRKLFK